MDRLRCTGLVPLRPYTSTSVPFGAAPACPAVSPAPQETVDRGRASEAPATDIPVRPRPPGAPPNNAARLRFDVTQVAAFPSCRVTFVFDAAARENVANPVVIGSWDAQGRYDDKWTAKPIPMQAGEDGLWSASLELQNDAPRDWQWGVLADVGGRPAQWMITTEGNRHLSVQAPQQTETFAPTTYHKMGVYPVERAGGPRDAGFTFWAPRASDVWVKILDDAAPLRIPMASDVKSGMWHAEIGGGFDRFAGKPYVYEVTTSEGVTHDVPDPYARSDEGSQRGLSRIFLDSGTGQETHQYLEDAKLPLFRFEVQGHDNADAVYLVLRDGDGRALNKQDLLARIPTMNSKLVLNFHQGRFSDLWSDVVLDDGRIPLVKQGRAWAALVNDPSSLDGLRYEFHVMERRGGVSTLVGDANGDGVLQASERQSTAFNDAYDNQIHTSAIGSPRASLITDPSFDWKHDRDPRIASDPRRFIIYQMHVGSVFGEAGNVTRSTFRDVENHLDYLKGLGVNTVELLPTNEIEGLRDWGYVGTSRFAQSQAYGFEDADGRWVSGTEALKRFVDAAHSKGFNVFNDVVYNHFGGDYETLWQEDGAGNSWYNWQTNTSVANATASVDIRTTPWGPIPAVDHEPVRQFVVDNAAMQVEELHFDGLRFDFVHGLQDQGAEAWNTLRQINRTLKLFKPQTLTVAEEFPYDTSLTDPIRPDGTGAGFDAEWNTEFQHRLVHDSTNAGVLQQAAHGQRTDMDRLMDEIVNHPFFSAWDHSITIISDHDEVGNGERTVTVASADQTPQVSSPWARAASRLAFGTGMLSPGIPMFFQGEESLATNSFKWAIPSTWDTGWDWTLPSADPTQPPAQDDENAARRFHYTFCKDAIALRNSSPAFLADTPAARIYTHNDNAVFAFSRNSGGDDFVLIGSLNKSVQRNYSIPVPPGKWQLVLNSDDVKYGGSGVGDVTAMSGGVGARFDLPAGGLLVYKRVAG